MNDTRSTHFPQGLHRRGGCLHEASSLIKTGLMNQTWLSAATAYMTFPSRALEAHASCLWTWLTQVCSLPWPWVPVSTCISDFCYERQWVTENADTNWPTEEPPVLKRTLSNCILGKGNFLTFTILQRHDSGLPLSYFDYVRIQRYRLLKNILYRWRNGPFRKERQRKPETWQS